MGILHRGVAPLPLAWKASIITRRPMQFLLRILKISETQMIIGSDMQIILKKLRVFNKNF